MNLIKLPQGGSSILIAPFLLQTKDVQISPKWSQVICLSYGAKRKRMLLINKIFKDDSPVDGVWDFWEWSLYYTANGTLCFPMDYNLCGSENYYVRVRLQITKWGNRDKQRIIQKKAIIVNLWKTARMLIYQVFNRRVEPAGNETTQI